MDKPILYFIAGPNGSGKSTLIERILKKEPYLSYVCPDREALFLKDIEDQSKKDELSWENARKKRAQYLEEKVSFINETVFSHPSHLDFLRKAKENGFYIICFCVILKNADICIERVKKRQSEGGHGVSLEKIKPRYDRCMDLLPELIKIVDYCTILDNSEKYQPLFYKEKNSYVVFGII